MALLEKHRNTIYTVFEPLLGEEATQAMLSQFPARDVESPVTKEFLADELHRELRDLGDRLTARMPTVAALIVTVNGALVAALVSLLG